MLVQLKAFAGLQSAGACPNTAGEGPVYCGGLLKDTEQEEAEEAEGLAAKESQNTCIMNSVSSRKAGKLTV